MEVVCTRCHQSVPADSCFCSACGLPQLVYLTDEGAVSAPAERWTEAMRDASAVDWKPALRAAALFAVPAGVLCCDFSPVSRISLIWMASAAAWAVALYVRRQRAAWITTGAGARIGLVTGLMAGWLAFAVTAFALFAERVLLHRGPQMDADWYAQIDVLESLTQKMMGQLADPAQIQAQKNLWLSPEGHVGMITFGAVITALMLMLFSMLGGALGARFMARSRRPEA